VPLLTIDAVSKSYGAKPVLRGVSLDAEAGSITALLGPSGCGKTTLLRIVAGLETADSGAIRLSGAQIDTLPPHQRGFGMMFQDYALFPHLDVAGNIAFGLRMGKLPAGQVGARVAELLELVGLQGYERRRVFALSGGERQRVALARALAPRPRLLMLDEPLAALDRTLRERLQQELRGILRAVGVTALYVTHDQEEAFGLADMVALLNAGRLEQFGPPEQIYRRPASAWAARFLGLGNLLEARWRADGLLETALGPLVARSGQPPRPGEQATLVIYPDAARPAAPGQATLQAQVLETQFRGQHYRVSLRSAAGPTLSFELQEPPGAIGETVGLTLDPDGLYALPTSTALADVV
jgi:ABC-type Fe3+/spermidine/putrescine transport system ATPase subunit